MTLDQKQSHRYEQLQRALKAGRRYDSNAASQLSIALISISILFVGFMAAFKVENLRTLIVLACFCAIFAAILYRMGKTLPKAMTDVVANKINRAHLQTLSCDRRGVNIIPTSSVRSP